MDMMSSMGVLILGLMACSENNKYDSSLQYLNPFPSLSYSPFLKDYHEDPIRPSPDICRALLDDIVVKGPKTTYDNELVLPGVCKYILSI